MKDREEKIKICFIIQILIRMVDNTESITVCQALLSVSYICHLNPHNMLYHLIRVEVQCRCPQWLTFFLKLF
jgi:hypothetical protein